MPETNFALKWDDIGEKVYETGCDRGVLYPVASNGTYPEGHAWNGLTGIDESPSGADSNKEFANNEVYANLRGAEEYGGSISAFTYPDAWKECDGHVEVIPGVTVGQQNRKGWGLTYRTLKGNDTEGLEYGYIIHLVYGATTSPASRSHQTNSDSPELETLNWDFDTVPVAVNYAGAQLKKTSTLDIDSTTVDPTKLADLEAVLYGTAASGNTAEVKARLPLPSEVIEILTAA